MGGSASSHLPRDLLSEYQVRGGGGPGGGDPRGGWRAPRAHLALSWQELTFLSKQEILL